VVPAYACSCEQTRGQPARQPAKPSHGFYRLRALFDAKVMNVLMNNPRHSHAQGGGKILRRHFLLPFGRSKQRYDMTCQVARIRRPIEINR